MGPILPPPCGEVEIACDFEWGGRLHQTPARNAARYDLPARGRWSRAALCRNHLPGKRRGHAMRRAIYLLLLAPYLALGWVPFYDRALPDLAGIPFFYWYQLL